jgi:hypothetical protein
MNKRQVKKFKKELRESYTRVTIQLLDELGEKNRRELWNGIDELVERKIIYDFRKGEK